MNIKYGKSKRSIKASNEGRSDLIYVIMDNGDPIAKGSYDAMVKKLYTYNYPVQMLKFPKAKLNSLMKMAKDAHRPDPLKFAVNRFINDYTDEYDSLNASCTKKSVKAGYQLQFPYMVEGEFADGYTYTAGGNSEAECAETLANMQDKHGELVWYSGVTDEDYDAGRRVDSACRRKSVKAAFRDNTIDKDAVRELVLTITNDGDQYRRQITPVIDNLKRKYKKGTYNRDLAVKLWQYVADEGVRRYNKEFGSGTASVAWLNPATRKAIAEELRDDYEEEIMYDDSINASRCKAPRRRMNVMAGPGAGYTIEWELDSIRKINSFDVVDVSKPDEWGTVTVTADCDVDIDVTIKSAWSYMYGFNHPIEGVSAKIHRVVFDYNISDNYGDLLNFEDYENLTEDSEYIDEVMNAVYQINEMEAMNILENDAWETIKGDEFNYGGGWVHSTWDGTILEVDEYHFADIQVTNQMVIEYVDAAVTNENLTIEYRIDDYIFRDDYFESEEEAREAAIEAIQSGEVDYDLTITKTEWHDILLNTEGEYDYDDPYDVEVATIYYDDYVIDEEE